VRNRWRFRWWDYPIHIGLTLLLLLLIFATTVTWFDVARESQHLLLGIALALTVAANTGLWLSRWLMLPLMQQPEPMQAAPGWRVGAATTFVPGAESLEMLETTLKGMLAMHYPHDTWVLDEGDAAEVKALCARLGVHYFTRKHKPHYQTASGTFKARTKYGNYNAWLDEIGYHRYDMVAAFDTDHVPQPDFLDGVLGYFNDAGVGYVQAPSAYYNQRASFIARGAAEETYAYFSSIQMTSYSVGYPVITGCHNTHRVAALRQVGGFAAHDADDMLLTVHYRVAGWRGVYVPKILARGLTPVDWSGYMTQQRRWARSTLDIKFNIYPKVARRLPALERLMSFFQGIYYLRSLLVAVQMGLLALILVTGATPAGFSGELFWLMSGLFGLMFACDMYRQRFFVDAASEWGLHWRAALLEYAKWPIFLLAVFDVLRNYQGSYTITPKVRTQTRQGNLARPHLLIAAGLAGAWGLGLALGNGPALLLALTTAFIIGMSLTIAATSRMAFPPSYDPALFAECTHEEM
jgi:cellulose synthase (UDP-forming)